MLSKTDNYVPGDFRMGQKPLLDVCNLKPIRGPTASQVVRNQFTDHCVLGSVLIRVMVVDRVSPGGHDRLRFFDLNEVYNLE